jgi:hypothetical protein
VARTNRPARRRRSRPADDRGAPPIQIHVTVTLHGQLMWLLTGIAIGRLRVPGRLLENVSMLIRGLVSG